MTREIRYGIVPAPEAARLSGRELLQGVIEGRFPAPPITERLLVLQDAAKA